MPVEEVGEESDQSPETESLLPQKTVAQKMLSICTRCQSAFNLQGEDSKFHANKIDHCSDCDVCIIDLDHHCIFFDGCIAQKNDCLFGCVLLGFFAMLIYLMILAGIAAHNGQLKDLSVIVEEQTV